MQLLAFAELRGNFEYLSKAYSETKAGGYIVITTGDISSLLAKIQRNNWRMIHPPTHLHYFSKRTLTKLLERIGYYVDKIRKGVAYGSGVILALSMSALIGGTKNAFTFTIIEYSGGVFICTTIVPKLFKKIYSLLD